MFFNPVAIIDSAGALGKLTRPLREYGEVILTGERVSAPRMLLLNRVDFEPGCSVFELEQPLFLRAGDQLWAEDDRVVVERTSGDRERPAGGMASVYRRWRLL